MLPKNFKSGMRIFFATLCITILTSCTKDLNRLPFVEVTSATVFNDPASFKEALAKLYAGLAVSGQQGPAGKPDIAGIDEGFSQYLRQYFQTEELPTDEAVIGWSDGTLPELHRMTWTSSNEFIGAMYSRIYYQISLVNEFLRQTTDDKLKLYGATDPNIKTYRAEARFLRALSYSHAIDLFGNVPFATDANPVGAFLPPQISRTDLFNYVESELKAIESDLVDPKKNEYGRADKAAAWTLLAKLYLNAQVYTGTPRFTDCVTYCNKVISGGYALSPNYQNLFLTDNNTSPEIIFPIVFDGANIRTWGGMTYLVHAPIGGSMKASDFGVDGGWGGLRTTSAFVSLFKDSIDTRNMFYKNGQNLEITNISSFSDGYAIAKYKNVSSKGVPGSSLSFPDTDFPMFRLADVYLMYAEAVLRGGTGGDNATALGYFNQVRQRAYKNTSGNVATLNLDMILDERGRELVWEGQRRTDLIRFGKFTGGNYLWAFKGNVPTGKAVEDYRVLYPIPAADLIANPTLKQNPGY